MEKGEAEQEVEEGRLGLIEKGGLDGFGLQKVRVEQRNDDCMIQIQNCS